MAQQDNEAGMYARGLVAMADLGQLGRLEPKLARIMIDSASSDAAVMEKWFPGVGRDGLRRAYEDSARDLAAGAAFEVERTDRASARRRGVEQLARRSGLAPARVESLLAGRVESAADRDDLDRLNGI